MGCLLFFEQAATSLERSGGGVFALREKGKKIRPAGALREKATRGSVL
jgi:hypothetical protein